MKIIRRIILMLGVGLLLFLAALYCIAPGMILHPRRVNWDRKPEDFQLVAEKITVNTKDSVAIKAIWVHQAGDTAHRKTIIMLHGIGNCKERWLTTAQHLWKEGFSTVLIDQRAHGESGGDYCTYGYFEKYDVSAVVDYILQRDSNAVVGVWGHSLGGAVALQALAIEPRLRFGVVESTFANFRDIVYDYQWRMFKVNSHTFADNAIERAAAQSHFDPNAVRPSEAARQVRQPIFMGHGDADEKISIRYGQQIFANLASTDKQFYTVQGGDHSNIGRYGGEPYYAAILHFLKRQ